MEEVVTLDNFEELLKEELHTNMTNIKKKTRLQDYFVPYRTIIRRNDMKWIITHTKKVAVSYVLSAI